ncbi:ribosome small subunit-dependent GTPase A [Paraliobacillus sp. JSM ZJ581]|uniref:ribosome small subunit-dependent GTPase A n=1 Tax=Paraliobacillus sp. JSM ZJ581 TaxID=3342118 RepID=UPI0035A92799
MPDGKIMKALSGFYYVKTERGLYQCRGRGLFRKKKLTPLVGDNVNFDIQEDNEGYITAIKERRNELKRPAVANIDQAIIVVSAKEPDFSTLLLDRFLVLVEANDIRPIIFISKIDKLIDTELAEIQSYQSIYQKIGYQVELISAQENKEYDQLSNYFANKISVIAGQSGVGKSSLLNRLNPTLEIDTNEISTSLGRGKHTTRHVELVEIYNGLVADTPGFSSLEFDTLDLQSLPVCFPEITKRQHDCKFRGCMHVNEPKCAVKQAVDVNEIALFRYEHYLQFYQEIQSRKPRY